MKYLVNAFTPAMIAGVERTGAIVEFCPVQAEEVPDCESAVGHEGTAQLLSQILGRPIEVCRKTLQLKEGDTIYLFQLLGPRPSEGKVYSKEELSTLPYCFLKVRIFLPFW